MRPLIDIDDARIAANARAWKELAGVSLRAVLKANGYGWGFERIIRAVGAVADAYCVLDARECFTARRFTAKPIVLLSSVPDSELERVLDCGAIPTVTSPSQVERAGRWGDVHGRDVTIRAGIMDTGGWSTLTPAAFSQLAPVLGASNVRVELWTHITDRAHEPETLRLFDAALDEARSRAVRVVGTDVASTFALASGTVHGTAVRVGIGLFGATGGPPVEGVGCALRVRARIERRERYLAGTRVGYGTMQLHEDAEIVSARCGYADGLPAGLAGNDGVITVGMQYVSALASRYGASGDMALVDERTDFDAFARAAGRLPHEIVTAFANAANASAVRA